MTDARAAGRTGPAGRCSLCSTGCRAWPGRRGEISALPGGLTNQNYKVTTPDGVFVARVCSDGGDLLAIDRDHEYQNSVIAAAAGVGAPGHRVPPGGPRARARLPRRAGR